jgi:hypothetical protein
MRARFMSAWRLRPRPAFSSGWGGIRGFRRRSGCRCILFRIGFRYGRAVEGRDEDAFPGRDPVLPLDRADVHGIEHGDVPSLVAEGAVKRGNRAVNDPQGHRPAVPEGNRTLAKDFSIDSLGPAPCPFEIRVHLVEPGRIGFADGPVYGCRDHVNRQDAGDFKGEGLLRGLVQFQGGELCEGPGYFRQGLVVDRDLGAADLVLGGDRLDADMAVVREVGQLDADGIQGPVSPETLRRCFLREIDGALWHSYSPVNGRRRGEGGDVVTAC